MYIYFFKKNSSERDKLDNKFERVIRKLDGKQNGNRNSKSCQKISLFEIFFVFYFLYNLKRTFGAKMEHLFQIIVFTVRVNIYRQIDFTFGRNVCNGRRN